MLSRPCPGRDIGSKPLSLQTDVGLAREGDADAFEELVRRYSGRIYGVLVRTIGDSGLAEDAAQETFIRAWRAMFRGDAQFSTWIYRIAINEANRILAREARREVLPFDDVILDVPDIRPDPPTQAEIDELRAQLEQGLRNLPPNYRLPVVLRNVEGLSNEEAAEVLDLNLRNFKSRLHRGRMALRKRLEELAATS